MPAKSLRNKITLLACIIMLSGCATVYNEATQRKEVVLINTQQEISLGRNMDSQVRKKMKVLEDPEMQKRLNQIGIKVAAASDRQDLRYIFTIINDKELNAFAIPGGFIYVNNGLLQSANDDELACVLAHEIGHIAARHSVKKLETTMGYQILAGIAAGVSGQQALVTATDIAFNLGSLGYSRKDELLADKLAVKYARKAGYSPIGMATFLDKLKKEAEKKGELRIPFLSSHPGLGSRIENIDKEISNQH